MVQIIRDWFADWNAISIIVRLLIAALVGFLLGFNREVKNKPAGIRTHILVCLGTALATMSAVYVLNEFPDTNIDVTRLGGQMLAGIGFLGAGVIFVSNKNRIEGLTSAAGMWACTCCGMAIGFGFFEGTLVTVILVVITMFLLPLYERNLHRRENQFDLYLEFEQGTSPAGFLRLLHTEEIMYTNYHVIQEDNGKDGDIAIISISMERNADKEAFLSRVRELDGLKYLHEQQPKK